MDGFKFSLRQHKPFDSIYPFQLPVSKKEVLWGGPHFQIVAGPCSAESEEQLGASAAMIKEQGGHFIRAGIFKPRTSPFSFQGLGVKGLELLANIRKKYDLLVVTEIMDEKQLPQLLEVADILQVGARNSQNYTLLEALGRCNKPILLKRGLAGSIKELLFSAEYIMANGNSQVILCERGIRTFEDAYRNVVDINAIPYLREVSHLPVLLDPSHGTGRRSLVESVAYAGVAAGAHGLLLECHPTPDKSWTDADQAISLETASRIFHKVPRIREAILPF